MADASKQGASKAQQPQAQQSKARAPPRTSGTTSGGPRQGRGRSDGGGGAGAGATAHSHNPAAPRIHPPTPPPPGQMMAYPQQHPQQHPQHPQHPQYPQRMGPSGMTFQHAHPPPPPPPPPAFFPGSASLFEQLDKRVMVGGMKENSQQQIEYKYKLVSRAWSWLGLTCLVYISRCPCPRACRLRKGRCSVVTTKCSINPKNRQNEKNKKKNRLCFVTGGTWWES